MPPPVPVLTAPQANPPLQVQVFEPAEVCLRLVQGLEDTHVTGPQFLTADAQRDDIGSECRFVGFVQPTLRPQSRV
jgi:hypothetical protein